jgi:SH3-like domain-containing protein
MIVASLIATLLLADAAVAAAPREAVVTVAVENMYGSADDTANVVSQATLGQVVEVLETSGVCARVRTPDTYEGWIQRAAIMEYLDAAPRHRVPAAPARTSSPRRAASWARPTSGAA